MQKNYLLIVVCGLAVWINNGIAGNDGDLSRAAGIPNAVRRTVSEGEFPGFEVHNRPIAKLSSFKKVIVHVET